MYKRHAAHLINFPLVVLLLTLSRSRFQSTRRCSEIHYSPPPHSPCRPWDLSAPPSIIEP
ncbi:hypothetical protein K469DRAFT_721487 [Zopfia rhizophila CBS 207.26]|uniref:Secreted protein n=1 Tax=Zopfia rhizophila CBS 207.26 TaxID=1314779 RepID=A0A6A6EHK7_9PEZI|nr:hypothetical protein K469DRAFT_721487 [Zopfia rhizophila CBS 207.26]